jgi:hypothetical protein
VAAIDNGSHPAACPTRDAVADGAAVTTGATATQRAHRPAEARSPSAAPLVYSRARVPHSAEARERQGGQAARCVSTAATSVPSFHDTKLTVLLPAAVRCS